MSLSTPIVVIAGPTASGKTALALALSRELGGELVGADSVQVYRGFDIGSAKPTPEELAGIPHHLIDVLDPDEPIDAMRYADLADAAIDAIADRGHVPIVVGGTGLWIRALVRGLVELPPVDLALRTALEQELERVGSRTMHERLAHVDPLAASRIHANDALRIVRALEIYEQTGEPVGELRRAHALGAPRRPTLFVVLEPPLEELTHRIESRIDAMLEQGWLEEVARLRDRWGDGARALGSVGYRELMQHLRDGLPLDEARLLARNATRTYGRRQRNWFRAEPGVDLRITDLATALDAVLPRARALASRS